MGLHDSWRISDEHLAATCAPHGFGHPPDSEVEPQLSTNEIGYEHQPVRDFTAGWSDRTTLATEVQFALPTAMDPTGWTAEVQWRTSEAKTRWEQDLGAGLGGASVSAILDLEPGAQQQPDADRAHVFVRLVYRDLDGNVRSRLALPLLYAHRDGSGSWTLSTREEAEDAGLDTTLPPRPGQRIVSVDERFLEQEVPPRFIDPSLDLD